MVRFRLALALPFVFFLGCTPKIGDKCVTSTDCSQLGDRLCDTTEPDGYCTIFNCEPDTCPSSMCVGFNFSLDPACGSADDGRWGRFERTYCMAPCYTDANCREGYLCLNPRVRNAQTVDEDPIATKVCMSATSLPPNPAPASTPGVCEPGDAGDNWTPYHPDAGAGGGGP